jgi:hypothetical protein
MVVLLAMVIVGEPLVAVGALFVAGLGLANGAPLLFSAGGDAKDLSVASAIAATATMADIGLLMGPPILGVVAQQLSLGIVLSIVAGLVGLVALGSGGVGL